ncbi:MAG: DUF3604 domain-containing protein, partial [bacterium]|nr:DUF3604 domain-containing protein [bacterium]
MRWIVRVVVVASLAACVWLLGQDDGPAPAGFQSFAKYQGEEEAIRKAENLGVGEVSWQAPAEVVVNSHMTWTIRFTVGQAGMKTGGGIWLSTAHDFGWDMWGGVFLQTTNPRMENYLTYRTSTGAALDWKVYGGRDQPSVFGGFHPWQRVNAFTLTGDALAPGDSIEVTIGDTSGGSPGVRVQEMDEEKFQQKVYVDALGDGEYLPLRNSPHVRVAAGPARELKVIAATDWVAGQPGWVNVWFDDGYGNPAESYRGEISVEAEPALDYTFTAADRGAHRFETMRYQRPGTYRLRVRSKDGSLSAESNPFVVHASAPRQRAFWGDLHTHTMYSDGRGTPAETYAFGKRVAALDFAAVSDHAFIVKPWMWREIIDTTNRYNQDGRYVTLLGYEWSGRSDVGGDHNVYTSDPQMPIIRSANGYSYDNLRMYHGPNDELNLSANHVENLFRLLGERFRDENLLAIPHYGGRRGNPAWHNPRIQRQIEIFSDHRRSEDWTSTFLEKGYRIGVMASTDNHSGNAGYGVRRTDV